PPTLFPYTTLFRSASVQCMPDVAAAPARECYQAFSADQPFAANLGTTAALIGQERLRQQFAEAQITLVIAYQQQQAERFVGIVVVGQPDVAARDGLDAFAARAFVEFDQAENIGQIGQRHGGLT